MLELDAFAIRGMRPLSAISIACVTRRYLRLNSASGAAWTRRARYHTCISSSSHAACSPPREWSGLAASRGGGGCK